MASLNLSFALFNYSNFQINPHERQYYHHACYNNYLKTKRCKINLEKSKYLSDLENEVINKFHTDYVNGYLSKELKLPMFSVDNDKEVEYRNYLLMCRLFLEPCLDILGAPCFAIDSIQLPLETDNERNKEFVGLFDQIKQEYNTARFLWFKSTVLEEPNSLTFYADKELNFVNLQNGANHSIRESLLRLAFKTAYSLFDRIGYFLNSFYEVGLSVEKRQVSFKNIWKKELGSGKNSIKLPNPIENKFDTNPFLKAIFWLQKDFFDDTKTNVTSPHAEPMFEMRNNIEHNCTRTVEFGSLIPGQFTKYTLEELIEQNTYRLLKLSRETIIYLCLSVQLENKNEEKVRK